MPPKPFRVVRLDARSTQSVSAASKEKCSLLTYKMALAQPNATVPLLSNRSVARYSEGAQQSQPHALDFNRRWVRDADELCVSSIRRSNNINKINTYVATYKFDDPHWRPFLLPDVHVLPSVSFSSSAVGNSRVEELDEKDNPVASSNSNSGDGSSSSASSSSTFDVFIDYGKQTNIELISRHANFALRHLVQKGHAMYFVNYSQHSILEMRGLVEASYITCAYGIKGERLRTHMLHVGPLDVRDVMELDPATGRVSFHLQKKNVRKGVVAVSLVEGYGTWFQRKPMLWQRTRRIGALQSQMGAFEYALCPSESVGRCHAHEVGLLEPHVKMMGAAGGAEAVGIIASSQVAQNDRLYMGQFEAPVITAVDVVQQLAHRTALHHHLVRPAAAPAALAATMAAEGEKRTVESSELAERRRLLEMERLLPVSWVTRTPPPYVPLESDLPFRVQIAKPAVFHTEQPTSSSAEGGGGGTETPSVVFPTGGTVGSPMVKGVPLSLFEYNIHQGVDHYIFDDAPSARPTKWWSQKSTMPYNGYLYCMRSGLLDYVVPAEAMTNPLASPSAAAHRRSSGLSQQQKRERRRRRLAAARREKRLAKTQQQRQRQHKEVSEDDDKDERGQQIASTTEQWVKGETDLTGHDEASLAAETALLSVEEEARYIAQRRAPLADVVPPSDKIAKRAARYERNLLAAKYDGKDTSADTVASRTQTQTSQSSSSSSSSAPGAHEGSAAEALLQRQLRQRAALRRRKKGKEKPSAHQ